MTKRKPCEHDSRKQCAECRIALRRQAARTVDKERKKLQKRAWVEANKERVAANQRAWYEAHKEHARAQRRSWYESNKARHLATRRAAKGMVFAPGQSEATLRELQGNACSICGRSFEIVRLNIDHDHDTGRVRGALCSTCNTGIGGLRDDVRLLARAIRYLNEHAEKHDETACNERDDAAE